MRNPNHLQPRRNPNHLQPRRNRRLKTKNEHTMCMNYCWSISIPQPPHLHSYLNQSIIHVRCSLYPFLFYFLWRLILIKVRWYFRLLFLWEYIVYRQKKRYNKQGMTTFSGPLLQFYDKDQIFLNISKSRALIKNEI